MNKSYKQQLQTRLDTQLKAQREYRRDGDWRKANALDYAIKETNLELERLKENQDG
jgi:hypothetical protein